MTDIVYPTGCRPLTEDLGTDELIRRLKTLAHTLQGMAQDDELCQQYIPLASHLVDEYFIQHSSKDVQLLVACCIADILRVYAPEAPYKEQEQIKTIFIFFIKQLQGLKDPKGPSFKRYFYLLENLAYVKSFNMCFDVEESPKIFSQLFSMIFKIINDEHSNKVKNFLIDILSPLITEADNFTTDLLDLILINIVEPYKSQNKYAYQLAEQLILKTTDSLESSIKTFFNQVLVMDKIDKNIAIANKIYELIYELHLISPNILRSILPQLECKLKSTNEAERLRSVSLLARMFSEKDSQVSIKHQPLLRMFLGRFCDISVAIRIKCVQSSMHFLLNQPHLRTDIIESLRARQHDSDETVRYEVVMAIVETAKRDFKIVCESKDLLTFVRERTLDKKFKIRKEAMNGLAYVYKQTFCEPNDLSDDVKKSNSWIKNKILHGYYMPELEDRLLVERLLITCLVPYKLPPDDRMKKLYQMLGTLDDHASKAFIELQKNQMMMRKTVSEWVKMHHSKDVSPKHLNNKQAVICKLLPDPLKASEYLAKFSQSMRKDPSYLRCMEIILKRDVSCKECAEAMSTLLKKLGNPIMTNVYYNTVKMLIERIASVMVDKESLEVLISLIHNCIQNGGMLDDVDVPRDGAGECGMQLLCMLSFVFPAHFFNDKTLRLIIGLMGYDEEPYAAPLALRSLTHLGRYRPLATSYPDILEELVPVCKGFALDGTVKQAKHAVRCIFVNSQSLPHTDTNNAQPTVHIIFHDIVKILQTTLLPSCKNHRTKIVTLGQIALNMPQTFLIAIKNMIARRIVKEVLIQRLPDSRDIDNLPKGEWCNEDELPEDTLCKLDAFKTMAHWLLGLKTDEHSAQKTFRMLSAFISGNGDVLEQNRLTAAEKSWLRLGAARAMLRVCEQKGVGDQFNAEQYFILSQIMSDPVPEVREMFARKLHKGLGKGMPNKCLPLDFMGFYALAGYETDKKISDMIRHFVEVDVNRRRDYMKTISTTESIINGNKPDTQGICILPDYMLSFGIPVLAHNPNFTNYDDRNQLKQIEKCLRFILEPLMARRDAFSYSFHTKLIEAMKNQYDITTNEDDDPINLKMWATCDLAMYIINSKIGQLDHTTNNTFAVQVQLPAMFFKAPQTKFENFQTYIPLDTYTVGIKKIQTTTKKVAKPTEKRTLSSDLLELNENSEDFTTNATEQASKRTRIETIETTSNCE